MKKATHNIITTQKPESSALSVVAQSWVVIRILGTGKVESTATSDRLHVATGSPIDDCDSLYLILILTT